MAPSGRVEGTKVTEGKWPVVSTIVAAYQSPLTSGDCPLALLPSFPETFPTHLWSNKWSGICPLVHEISAFFPCFPVFRLFNSRSVRGSQPYDPSPSNPSQAIRWMGDAGQRTDQLRFRGSGSDQCWRAEGVSIQRFCFGHLYARGWTDSEDPCRS